MEKVEAYENKVGFSERTNVPIEPKLSMQWFLKMEHLAQIALEPVMKDDIKFYPPKFKNTYRHWMENIKDWCISRQLWWGLFPARRGVCCSRNGRESFRNSKRKDR